jgi:hypothetical protein
MDAEALKIILDLNDRIHNRVLTDILLAIHYDDFGIKSLNYKLGKSVDGLIATIMHDLQQLKSKARLFDELQQQRDSRDNQ